MDEVREFEIYMEECGYKCPLAPERCRHQCIDGMCMKQEPWFDCEEFQNTHGDGISEAENRIANEEDAAWINECEHDSWDDEWDGE